MRVLSVLSPNDEADSHKYEHQMEARTISDWMRIMEKMVSFLCASATDYIGSQIGIVSQGGITSPHLSTNDTIFPGLGKLVLVVTSNRPLPKLDGCSRGLSVC